MALSENERKTRLVKEIKADGHYARRIEDQYGVGLLDMVVVVAPIGAVFVEAKLVRSGSIVATPRQRVEASRIVAAGGRACLIGFGAGADELYVGTCSDTRARIVDLIGRRPGESFANFLRRYYENE